MIPSNPINAKSITTTMLKVRKTPTTSSAKLLNKNSKTQL